MDSTSTSSRTKHNSEASCNGCAQKSAHPKNFQHVPTDPFNFTTEQRAIQRHYLLFSGRGTRPEANFRESHPSCYQVKIAWFEPSKSLQLFNGEKNVKYKLLKYICFTTSE